MGSFWTPLGILAAGALMAFAVMRIRRRRARPVVRGIHGEAYRPGLFI